MRIAFITDVEGNLDFLLQSVSLSPLLTYTAAGSLNFVCPDGPDCFVFGGDVGDKGPYDVTLCKMFVDFKNRYPSRVFLILGNRDLNKLRYTAELGPDDMKIDAASIPGPHWDPNAMTLASYLAAHNVPDSRPNRLKYMLEHTLGCKNTFEHRRTEMARLLSRDVDGITDEEVTEHIVEDVERGALSEFLDKGQIAVRLGDTMFVHGAIDDRTAGFIPNHDTKFEVPKVRSEGRIVEGVDEWIREINEYKSAGLLDFHARPYFNSSRTSRGGESLLALQNRDAMFGRSVVSSCFCDGGCITTDAARRKREEKESTLGTEPEAFRGLCSNPKDEKCAAWLKRGGVKRLVVGHKPSADCPAVLSRSYTGLEVVSGDTSFSDMAADDCRGQACSAITVTAGVGVVVEGILQGGERHKYDTSVDERVGTMTADGWWVQTKVGGRHRLIRGEGRNWEVKMEDEE